MYRILIIEDDATIANTIKMTIESWGNQASLINDFEQVIKEFVDYDPQLVLLDVSLPFYNGFYWCNEIRKVSKVPIIFISSASDNMSIVMAMNMGGDDYITKPFDLNVLSAKIQAVLRRTYDFVGTSNLLEHNGVVLNISDASITYQDKKIELTKNDFKMLQLLMENKGIIVSREEMMIKLWESDEYIDDNTLTVNMTRLRKKLEEIGISDFILTKKGLGYQLCEPE